MTGSRSMRAKLSGIVMVGVLLVIGPAVAFWLARDNAWLRREAGQLRRQSVSPATLRDENARLRALAERLRDEPATAIEQGAQRAESRRDADRPAAADETEAALAANRDPERDFVLVENFQNAGRASPSAAFQTLVWAAANNDQNTLTSILTFDPEVRRQLEARIAALPEAVRASYPTPERLAALFFAELVTGHTAARVLGQDTADPQHATVTIAFEHMPAGRPLPARLGAEGWQLAVTGELAAEFSRQMRGPPEKAKTSP